MTRGEFRAYGLFAINGGVLWIACAWAGLAHAQTAGCAAPFCVSRADDDISKPLPGTLRYALCNAPNGTVIIFNPSLNGKTITLDSSGPDNHIPIGTDVMIQGPGPDRLTISGGGATRI